LLTKGPHLEAERGKEYAGLKPVTDVGFVGLGNMGDAMARHLLAVGYRLSVYDREPVRGERLADVGATVVAELEDLAVASEAVFLALPGPAEVEQVTPSLVGAMPTGSVLINCSTVSPRLIREVEQAAQPRGVSVMDAPVSGAADGAREGLLTIMVGAEPEVFGRCRPLLEAVGRTIIHVGPVGAGSTAKLVTNLLWFVEIVALSQAFALGTKAGLNPRVLAELVPATAGASWASNHDLLNMIRGDDDDRFTLFLCCKDLRLIAELAEEVGVEIPLGDSARESFETAAERFGFQAGQLAVARIIEEMAGVSIRSPAPAIA
jgi:3-hydroxyisobutyrate dehydrogenase-like beta-hydroxyacid dehydrogenase